MARMNQFFYDTHVKEDLIICGSVKTEQIIVSPDDARVETLKSTEVLQNKTYFSRV